MWIGVRVTSLCLAALAVLGASPRPQTRPVPRGTPLATATPAPRPTPTPAPALSVQHDPVQCIIAGKYPKLSACFTPLGALKDAKVYFRGTGPTWYSVNMALEGQCSVGILPKPLKSLPEMHYYIEGIGPSFDPAKSTEVTARIVKGQSECESDRPAAPTLDSAPGLVVNVPPNTTLTGFTLGGFPTKLAVGGGAVVLAGGGALLLSGGDDTPTPTGTPTPTTAPTATPTATPTASLNLPPTLSCRLTPNPATGSAPFTLELNLCQTVDPEGAPLQFRFNFGDNTTASGFCRETKTYAPAVNTSYSLTGCATDGVNPEQCCTFPVQVTVPTPTPTNPPGRTPTPTPTTIPIIFFTDPTVWASQIDASGTSVQMVVNGAQAVYAGEGRAQMSARTKVENRVEAEVRNRSGRPGTWRLDWTDGAGAPRRHGGVEVLAGEVVAVTDTSVVFRVSGRKSERIAFNFRRAD